MLAVLGLAVCNEGNKPTFVRGASESHLDLTLATKAAVGNVTGWKILDEEALSLHKYIVFNVNAHRDQQKTKAKKGWAYRKIDHCKLDASLRCGVPPSPANVASACNQAITWLIETCDRCMPRSGDGSKRRPVFWWNQDIADQRKECLKARRAYTRKRKKVGESGSTAERENFKLQRKTLTIKIIEAKDKHWKDLCAQVDGDPWDTPYRIVMKRLARKKPIPGMETPGRLNSIVDTLFPDMPVSGRTLKPVSDDELDQIRFTETELKVAARGLPNGKASGQTESPTKY